MVSVNIDPDITEQQHHPPPSLPLEGGGVKRGRGEAYSTAIDPPLALTHNSLRA